MRNIIKRIIVGVGIALILMLIKNHGLVLQAHALSCEQYNVRYTKPFSDPQTYQKQINNNSNPSTQYSGFIFENRSSYTLTFDSNSDFMEVWVPVVWSVNNQSNNINNEFTGSMSYPMGRIIDNTNNTNNDAWNYMYYQDGYFKYRFDRSAYPNKNGISLRGFNVMPPLYTYNFGTTNFYLWVYNYWTLHDYKCDSNDDVKQAVQENTQAVQQVDDTLNDSSVDNNKASSDISTMQGKVATNGSITSLITLPITLYQAILNSANGSCSSFSLGTLFNHNLTLPCINLENLLGSTLWAIIDMLCSGLFILSFRKKMVDIFNHMTSLNDRGNELE